MATTLWHVEVFKVAGDTARLAVRVASADAGPFETGKAFVLRMLYEPASELGADYHRVALGPLADAISEDDLYDDDWLAKHAGDYIASVELANVTHGDVDRASSQARIEQALAAEGKTRGGAGWDELVEERMKQFWADPKNLPSAAYVIRATDGKWLAHLKPGQRWNSAAFA